MFQKWKYKVVSASDIIHGENPENKEHLAKILEEALNKLGERGWELFIADGQGTLILKKEY